MEITVCPDARALGEKAGDRAAAILRGALSERGEAHLVLATGASQFATLDRLVLADGIDWGRVVLFHLDEYLGMSASHPASFRRYLQERFARRVPALKATHFIRGDAEDPAAECRRLNQRLADHPIDLALIGIGENGHLAFNDPPADLDTRDPYIIVELDEACRRQQLGEGWFSDLSEVPRRAISMSVHQILQAQHLVCSVPDARKAEAVHRALRGPIGADCPASVLREHPACTLFLDDASASRL